MQPIRKTGDLRFPHTALQGSEAGLIVYALSQTVLGPVSRLSLEGMTFEYFEHDLPPGDPPQPGTNLIEMGLFMSGRQLMLTGIKGKVVSDAIIPNATAFLPGIRKQRSIRFTQLSVEQRQLLGEMVRLARG